jgi:PKD domain/IPT/TIG domain
MEGWHLGAPSALRKRRAPRARGAGARTRLGACVATLVGALLLACATAGSASAVIVQLSDGKTISYAPLRHSGLRTFDAFFSNLDYNGGPVMPSNTNYAVYWAPAGSPAYPSDYEPGIERYFKDLATDSGGTGNVESVSAQYNDAAGAFAGYESHFGGTIVDTQPYPVNGCKRAPICLTDAQLQTELKRLLKADGLPADLSHEYFMLTPPKVEDCLTAAGSQCSAGSQAPVYCAYHGDVNLGPQGVIVYATQPYVTGNEGCDNPAQHPNGSSSDGALIGGLSHEHNESITDPEPNNAWTDFGGVGGEIGDKCRTFEETSEFGKPLGTASNGAPYNQVINGHEYWYQQEWSNQTNQCLQRLSFIGEEPTATFTSAPVTGNEVRLDASGSTAPAPISRYNWQFNEGREPGEPVETNGPTVTHNFAAAGVYNVALTVFEANGTSIGTAHTVVVGAAPAPAITHVVPSRGPAAGGTLVKITGTAFSGATSVTFGTTAASFSVMSPTQILALAPAGNPATVDVHVQTPAGASAITLADHYRYVPTIESLKPSHGPAAGGTIVTVTGSGFALGTTGTTFRFGATKGTSVSCTSSSQCTVRSPAHVAGTVEVRAVVNAISSGVESTNKFVYE